MATGEKRVNFGERKVTKFQFKPVDPGEWDLKLNAGKAEIRKSKEKGPNAVPYINVSFSALGSGGEEGKDRLVFHSFFLKVTPGDNGQAMIDAENGIGGYIAALGLADDFQPRTMEVEDPDGNTIEILNPNDVLRFLQEHDGVVVRGRTRLKEKYGSKGEYEAAVSRFQPPEDTAGTATYGQTTKKPNGATTYR